jgi:hypothetical protein
MVVVEQLLPRWRDESNKIPPASDEKTPTTRIEQRNLKGEGISLPIVTFLNRRLGLAF